MRLHLVGLPHTTTTRDITVCAYTAKARKFCRMMEGWDLTLYWGDRNDAPVSELVTLHTEAERQAWYPGLTRETVATVGGTWNADDEPWRVMNSRAIAELSKRVQPHDLILLAGGWASHVVADAFRDRIVCEPGVGYSGWFTDYVCFESHTWRHHCYGVKGIHDGRFYDTVIPNFFAPDELPMATSQRSDYLVYIGRLIYRKGITVAADIARRAGLPLYVAGPGAREVSEGLIVCDDGTRLEGDVHYVGVIDEAGRSELVGRARALLAPTLYIEPFGGVAVEAQFMGTPAITSNWGAFTETVDPAFRFATIAEGAACVERAYGVDPLELRENAIRRWSLEAVRPQYERWFTQLSGLWGRGFYA